MAALPRMRERKFGRILFMSSVADMALAMLRNAYPTNQVISVDGGMYPR